MYARSHIYFTWKITGSANPYLLFGSLFADFHQLKVLPSGFDQQVIDLLKFCKENYPKFIPFAIGMTLHEFPIGIDRFVHQSYKGKEGYAFQFKEQLFEKTQEVLGFDDKRTILMTHFLVENAIEFKIINENPMVEKLFRNTIEGVDKEELLYLLSGFYGVEREELEKQYDFYIKSHVDYDYSTTMGQAHAWADMSQELFGKKVDVRKLGLLLKETQLLIEDSVDEFLEFVLKECTKDFEFNFGKMKELL